MLRSVVATALAGLAALAGPGAAPALATATPGPSLTLSAAEVRPGQPFTASAGVGCPAQAGAQEVRFTFTDSAGAGHDLGMAGTDEDGSWAGADLQVPVAGPDGAGQWDDAPVASGAGTLVATCVTSSDPDEDADPGDGDGADDGSDDGSIHSGSVRTGSLPSASLALATTADHENGDDENIDDEDGGDQDGDAEVTQTYAPAALTVSGDPARVSLSATSLLPGDQLTVTPLEPCPAAAEVEIDVVALGEDAGTTDSATATTDAGGAWAPVTIDLPQDADTGDYALSADCTDEDGAVISSYDGVAFAVGSIRLSAADCGGRTVTARLTGSYSGAVAGASAASSSRRAVRLPATIRLAGRGPWHLTLTSVLTGHLLLTGSIACPAPRYDLDVPRAGLGDGGRLRVRACNTGNVRADAVLQVLRGKRLREVDDQWLDAGDCTWLTGGEVSRGHRVSGRVLLDAPGRGDDVSESFTVRRR